MQTIAKRALPVIKKIAFFLAIAAATIAVRGLSIAHAEEGIATQMFNERVEQRARAAADIDDAIRSNQQYGVSDWTTFSALDKTGGGIIESVGPDGHSCTTFAAGSISSTSCR